MCHAYEHSIDTQGHKSVHQASYKVSNEKREKISYLVQELIGLGAVCESHSPWASLVALVKKKTGNLKLCIDYRKLNAKKRCLYSTEYR